MSPGGQALQGDKEETNYLLDIDVRPEQISHNM